MSAKAVAPPAPLKHASLSLYAAMGLMTALWSMNYYAAKVVTAEVPPFSAAGLRSVISAAAIMSLLHTAKLNGHDPYLYLKDVLERLPTQADNRIGDLLPYRWQPNAA